MRYLLTSLGYLGDGAFFGVLADELVRRGHEVILYGPPSLTRSLADSLARIVTIESDEGGGLVDGLLRADDDNRHGIDAVVAGTVARVPAHVSAMQADVVPARTVALGTGLGLAHRLLAEMAAIPAITLHQSPVSLPSVIRPARFGPGWGRPGQAAHEAGEREVSWLDGLRAWWAERTFYQPRLGSLLALLRESLGLPPLTQPVFRWLADGEAAIGLFPDWFASPPADWPAGLRLTGFATPAQPVEADMADDGQRGPADEVSVAERQEEARRAALARLPDDLRAFLEAGVGVAPVVFAGGPADGRRMDFFVQSVLGASRIGVRAILLCPHPRELPRHLPDNVIATSQADLPALLSQASALVHQGSIGLAAEALAAGVPQLCCPLLFEQFDTSARCIRLGVGAEIRSTDYRAQAVGEQLHGLLYDRNLHESCRRLAARIDGRRALQACCERLEAIGQAGVQRPAGQV